MTVETPQWPDEVVADNFRSEIRARFEAHNAAFRAREEAELEQVLRTHPEKRGQPGYEVHDSGAWRFYQACEIRIDRNTVTIVAPDASIDLDIVHLFDNTTMAWSKPWVKAAIVDGEPRITIEIVLVATWDDSLDSAWRKDGNDRKRVLVELFEDDVHMLRALVDVHGEGPQVRALHDRLLLALEPLP